MIFLKFTLKFFLLTHSSNVANTRFPFLYCLWFAVHATAFVTLALRFKKVRGFAVGATRFLNFFMDKLFI